MKEIRVQIEAVDDEGRGRAIYINSDGDEFDVAARGALPFDDVVVEVERVFAARKLLVAKAVEFLDKGPCHIKRLCPHQAPCPACPLHGADASLSIALKRGRIEQALIDVQIELDVEDVILHPSEFGYRQKVKLMAQVVDDKLRLGVYVPYSHRFVVAEQCPYVNPIINASITELLKTLNGTSRTLDLSMIKAVILRAGKDGVAAVIVAKKTLSDGIFAALQQSVSEGHLLSVTERVQSVETNSILAGDMGRQAGSLLIAPLEGGPSVDPDSFCQSDPDQATKMYDLVAEFLTRDSVEGTFLDAYAGVGGFTRALLRRRVGDIIAVEQSPSALTALSQLEAQIILTPMSEALEQLNNQMPLTGIVVDPPKKGLMEDAEAIARLAAKKLVLVSCDPDAMAKDLRVLLAHGYLVERIVPMDFFGGTPAIETIVFLSIR